MILLYHAEVGVFRLRNSTTDIFYPLSVVSSSNVMLPKTSFLTVVILLTGLLFAALLPLLTAGLSASHDPLREVSTHTERLAEMPDVDQDAANHDHDDDSAGSHQHAHSAIDHSHESLFVLPEHAIALGASAMPWSHRSGTDQKNAHVPVPERPPRTATA